MLRNKISIEGLLVFFTAVFAASLPFEIRDYFGAPFLATWLVYLFLKKPKITFGKEQRITLAISLLPFVLTLVFGLIYRTNHALKVMEYLIFYQVPLSIIFIYYPPITKKLYDMILFSFFISVSLLVLYLLYASYSLQFETFSLKNLYSFIINPKIKYIELSRLIDNHTPYISLYISVAILVLLYFFSRLNILMFGVVFGILIIALIHLESRAAIYITALYLFVLMLIKLFFYPLKLYTNVKFAAKRLLIVLLLGGLVFVFSNNYWNLKESYESGKNEIENFQEGKDEKSSWGTRWAIAKTVYKYREDFLWGAKMQTEEEVLDPYYRKENLNVIADADFGFHNQYLEYYVRYGILGAISMILYVLISFFLALKRKNMYHFLFSLIMTLIFIPESFLEIKKGAVLIFFFYPFFNLLSYQMDLRKEKEKD